MLLGLFAWLVPVVGPALSAVVVAAVLGSDRGPGLGYTGGYAIGAVLVLLAALGAHAAGAVGRTPALIATVTLSVTGSLAVVYRIDSPGGRWGRRLRSRLVMGVPWGTLVSAAFVLCVYLFVQGGASSWYDPVTLPFRAWSYLYPLGMVVAPFAHNSAGHLVGNLVGTLVLGSLAEYAWGHFPQGRGASSFGSLRTNPLVRAFLVVPGVVIGVGLLTSAFALGPVIGFSGVVFAFAGFALTRYPLGTVIATAGVGTLQLAYAAVRQPVLVQQAAPSPPSAPWWAQIAIQAHALGLLLGVVVGWFVFARRGQRTSALRLWTGVLLFAVQRELWAVYWFRGEETFVLYRGPGLVLVVVLALLVTSALTASERSLLGRGRRRSETGGGSGTAPGRPSVEADGGRESDGESTEGLLGGGDDGLRLSGRTVAVVCLLLGTALLAGPGVGSNVFTIGDSSPPEDGTAQIQVRDYTVTYAEDVTNERVAIVNVELFDETTTIRTSGVIVSSERRGIWQQVVSKGRLAFDGTVEVDVGGVGWRESVTAIRRGWSADGGGTAYKVWLRPDGGERRLAFRSDPATAADTIAGRNVSVSPGEQGFFILVKQGNESLDTVRMPAANESVTAGGLTFTNREGTVYASINGTRVEVFTEETYQ